MPRKALSINHECIKKASTIISHSRGPHLFSDEKLLLARLKKRQFLSSEFSPRKPFSFCLLKKSVL